MSKRSREVNGPPEPPDPPQTRRGGNLDKDVVHIHLILMASHSSPTSSPLRLFAVPALALALLAGDIGPTSRADDKKPATRTSAAKAPANLPKTLEEARGRARWLHEVVHGALQVMHRDFFDEDLVERSLPSQSLDDVFAEMSRSHSVEIRWLGVNATRGKDHLPKDRFEEQAAAALLSGQTEYEAVEKGRYRFAGHIRLQNECLKCHVRDRTTLEDRVAGLAIAFPMAAE